jgi:hypothetical protein
LHPSHKPKPPTLHRHRAPSPGLRRLLPRLIRPSLAVGSVRRQEPSEIPQSRRCCPGSVSQRHDGHEPSVQERRNAGFRHKFGRNPAFLGLNPAPFKGRSE